MKHAADWLLERNVDTVYVGDLTDILDTHWSAEVNEKTHAFWSHRQLIDRLELTLGDIGISVEQVSEAHSSSECPSVEARMRQEMVIRSGATTASWTRTVTPSERGICYKMRLGRWRGPPPWLLDAAGTYLPMGRTGSGMDTTGNPRFLGNSRVRLTKPASANPQVHSRGNLLAGLPTEESHDFSRVEDVKRDPNRRKGSRRDNRPSDDVRLHSVRRVHAGRRVNRHATPARCRGDRSGEDHDAGLDNRLVRILLADRADEEPVRPGARSGWLEQRHRRGRRREPGSGRHRNGLWWVDPCPRVVRQPRRVPRDPWPDQSRRRQSISLTAGHGRTNDTDGPRHRDVARRPRRLRRSGRPYRENGTQPAARVVYEPSPPGRVGRLADRRPPRWVR
ncbi:IS1341-type transposase [Natronorubrum tibetense GA33]|uniref:IS1341-type transposase n=1 Tax=Natronorubrum tibetense GA33 TaxID=1114856 RepID=L9VN29_9EURY|nr:IS1341-type transposase [Natronorubrum tibetense GA33]